jgi:hypothetical protein
MTLSSLGQAALDYAARDWPVLALHTPCEGGCSCRRPDCSSVGKHPRTLDGLKGATTNPAVITKWWTMWPEANIGLLTGVAFDALDLDSAEAVGRSRPCSGMSTKTRALSRASTRRRGSTSTSPPPDSATPPVSGLDGTGGGSEATGGAAIGSRQGLCV